MLMIAVVIILFVIVIAMFVVGRGSSDTQDTTASPISGNAGKESPDDVLLGRNNPASNETISIDDLPSAPPISPSDRRKTSQGEQEREWTGFRSPEEEYIQMRQGDKEKSLVDFGNGFGSFSTKERRGIEVQEPCGFRFNDAIVNTNEGVNLETGEIGGNSPFITPDLNNFAKMINDWKDLDFFWEAVGKKIPQFPMSKVLFYINNLKFLPTRKTDLLGDNNIFRDHDYTSHIVVEPLTKTGKVKKFPIRTMIGVTWNEPFDDWYGKKDQGGRESIHLSSYYLKDGRIGKGEINIWIDQDAYIMDFALDTKNDEYYVKKVRTNVGVPMGEWKVIYPFG